VADGFCEREATQEKADFPALRCALQAFGAEEQHGAWSQVGWKFRDLGDLGTANLCFAEGLTADPDPASTLWSNIQFLPGVEQTELGQRLSRFPDRPTAENRTEAAILAKLLGERLGVDRDSASPAIAVYNRAVRNFHAGNYTEAATELDSIFSDEVIGLCALYLWGLCRSEAGQSQEIPEGFADRIGEAYSLFTTYGLVSRLYGAGARVAITSRGNSCMMKAELQNTIYTISAVAMAGSLLTMAWKKQGGQDIPLNDRSLNPNPSAIDHWITDLVADAPNATATELPWWRIPDSLS